MGRLAIIIPLLTLGLVFATAALADMRRTEFTIAAVLLLATGGGLGAWYWGVFDWLAWRQVTADLPAEERRLLDMLEPPGGSKEGASVPGPARICGAPGPVADWVGKVGWNYHLIGDKVALSVRIAPNVILRNADGFGESGAWIRPGSALYEKLKGVKAGDTVRFSGRFERDAEDCLVQGRADPARRGGETEFLFEFSDLAPAG